AQTLLDSESRGGLFQKSRCEHGQLAATVSLGLIQSGVGRAQQALGIGSVLRVDADSRADTQDQLPAGERQRLLKCLDELQARDSHILNAAGAFIYDSELITTQARRETERVCRVAQTLRDRLQQLVAVLVPQAVVHMLEVVDIDEEHTDHATLSRGIVY